MTLSKYSECFAQPPRAGGKKAPADEQKQKFEQIFNQIFKQISSRRAAQERARSSPERPQTVARLEKAVDAHGARLTAVEEDNAELTAILNEHMEGHGGTGHGGAHTPTAGAQMFQNTTGEEIQAQLRSLQRRDDELAALAAKGVTFSHVTLHVGAGTFLPVKVDDISEHKMHAEWGRVSAEAAKEITATRAAGGRVIPVGTTALRLIETAARGGQIAAWEGDTDIFITPGSRFGVVDMLLTNFHLPKSTLLMLVSAFAGMQPIRDAYAHALDGGYRFFSYGDACLLRLDPAARAGANAG